MKVAGSFLRPAVTFAVLAFILLAPSPLSAAGGGGGHQMTMSEILWDLGIKFLNVSVLGFFAFKLLSRPLNRLVDARAAKIHQELEAAKSANREAEERLQKFRVKTSGIDAEIEDLRKQALADIDQEQKILLEEVRQAAEHLRQHARDSIRQEVAKARDDLHREAVGLAAGMAAKLVAENIGPEDHDRLVNEYLEEMETSR